MGAWESASCCIAGSVKVPCGFGSGARDFAGAREFEVRRGPAGGKKPKSSVTWCVLYQLTHARVAHSTSCLRESRVDSVPQHPHRPPPAGGGRSLADRREPRHVDEKMILSIHGKRRPMVKEMVRAQARDERRANS